MAGADGDSFPVEHGADVVRMHVAEEEREDARLLFGGADEAQPGDLAERLGRVGEQIVLVRRDRVQAQTVHVLDRRAEPDRPRDVGRARLELVGKLVVGRLLEGDRADHVPAALPGRHLLEQLRPAVQDADAGRPEQLVAREGVEVAAQRLHVDREVRHGLGAVEEHRHLLPVRHLDDPVDGVDGAKSIRDVPQGDQLRARPDQAFQLVDAQRAVVIHRRHAQDRALLLAEHLPGHDVGVVLHHRDDDLVSGAHASPAVGLRY